MISKLSLGLAVLLASSSVSLAAPANTAAQPPKLDIKVFGGASSTTYVEMLETGRLRDTFVGWQAGFGARVSRREAFIEVLFSFNRWAFSSADPEIGKISGRVNSFELPFNVGYIPYKNPFFKLFLYAGYVNHFNTKVLVDYEAIDGTKVSLKLKPKDAELQIYQALARFGVNVDLAMFNFDFNYSISMNSATKTSYRTGYHQLQLNVAYLF